MLSNSRDVLVPAALAVLVFALYALGACRTVYVGDSGELVAAVHTLGIPHPSGYPGYVLLGKLWTLVAPFGSAAFQLSLFSAACAALACAVIYRVARRSLGFAPVLAAFPALLLAFGPSFWSQANVQRVYSLNAAFVALALACAFRWRETRAVRWLALTSLVCGLGATNHTFLGVFGLCFGLWAVGVEPRLLLRPAALAAALASFALGFLPYAYIPIRSRANPPLDWGNAETFGTLMDVVLRKNFAGITWMESPADLLVIALDFLASLGPELAWAGAGLALLGAGAALLGRDPATPRALVALPLLVMAANVLALAFFASRRDLFVYHRYYIPAYTMGALLAGVGARLVCARLPARARWLPLALPALLLATGWSAADRSRYRVADDFGRTLLQSLPRDARLIANDENVLFVLTYLHHVEGLRPDVDLILAGVDNAERDLGLDLDTQEVFFTHPVSLGATGAVLAPRGLAFQAVPAGTPPPTEIRVKRKLEGEDDPAVPKDFLTRSWIGHFHFMRAFTLMHTNWPEARRSIEVATRVAPDDEVLQNNLGGVLLQNGLFADALAALQRARAIDDRRIPNVDLEQFDATLAMLAAKLAAEREVAATMATDPRMAGASPGSARYHRVLADGLRDAGELLGARGHEIMAFEVEHGLRP